MHGEIRGMIVDVAVVLMGGDQATLAALAEGLTQQGFCARLADAAIDVKGADIVIIDGAKGADHIAEIRRISADMPVLALNVTTVAGATATLAKPLRMGTLVAQVNRMVQDVGLAIGEWRFIVPTRQLRGRDGSIVKLTPKEADILNFLYGAQGPIARSDLLGALWGYSDQATTHTVETHIHSLRRKLGTELLVTDAGGYRLNKGF